jgi:hypothetical protein
MSIEFVAKHLHRFIELNSLLAWLIPFQLGLISSLSLSLGEISSQVLELGGEGHKSVVVDFNLYHPAADDSGKRLEIDASVLKLRPCS